MCEIKAAITEQVIIDPVELSNSELASGADPRDGSRHRRHDLSMLRCPEQRQLAKSQNSTLQLTLLLWCLGVFLLPSLHWCRVFIQRITPWCARFLK